MGLLKETLDHYGLKEEDAFPKARSRPKVHFDLEPSVVSIQPDVMYSTSQQVDPPIVQNPPPSAIQNEITESGSTSMDGSGGISPASNELIQSPQWSTPPPVLQTAHQRAIPPRLGSQFERYTPPQIHTPGALSRVAAQNSSLTVVYYLSGVLLSSISALVGAVLLSFAPWNRKGRPKLTGGKVYKVRGKARRRHERDWLVKEATL